MSAGLRYARLSADGGGVTHCADEALPWGTALPDARAISLRRLAAGYDRDWYSAPQRQFVVVLSGVLEIEVGEQEGHRPGRQGRGLERCGRFSHSPVPPAPA
jgi:hypothetical protein